MSRETFDANGIRREFWNDTTNPRTVTFYDAAGVQSSQRNYTAAENTLADAAAANALAESNKAALLVKAKTAIAGNVTFLADGSVTQAEAVTQLQRITRQMDAVIKIVGNDLANQDGT